MKGGTDLGPLRIAQSEGRWRITLNAPQEISLELPPEYERSLRERLSAVVGAHEPHDIFLDLCNLPAISSRQLGLMLALQKAMRDRQPRLQVTGVHDGVRRLLELTRTDQFFEII